jgi:glyoxylase-like metal-dependent hydrolase (beta-lactamase superfamily II)
VTETPSAPHTHAHGPATAPSTPGEDPLPPVEQVRPGLWSIPVPIPVNSLRYVLVYAFETDTGLYLVDVGWNTDDAYAALSAGIEQMGANVADVAGLLVTHIHPDHYGLAGRVREASGAWIALHPADAGLVHKRYEDPTDLLARMRRSLVDWGAPADELDAMQNASMPALPFVLPALPDVLLEDGARPEVPGWDLQAIWTPGHSPGHLCFWEGRERLMLSGDHVLPRISPNVSYHPQAGPDPLGDFIRSLDKLSGYDASEVLPAHEHRFHDLPARIDALKLHHEHRLVEVVLALDAGHSTAWAIAQEMTWSRSWAELVGFARRAAVSEAVAHLHTLVHRGTVRVEAGEPMRWVLVG